MEGQLIHSAEHWQESNTCSSSRVVGDGSQQLVGAATEWWQLTDLTARNSVTGEWELLMFQGLKGKRLH